MDTLMPAERHFPTASGTAARGGSIMEIKPRKQSWLTGKFTSSQSNSNPLGNCEGERNRWQNPEREREGRELKKEGKKEKRREERTYLEPSRPVRPAPCTLPEMRPSSPRPLAFPHR